VAQRSVLAHLHYFNAIQKYGSREDWSGAIAAFQALTEQGRRAVPLTFFPPETFKDSVWKSSELYRRDLALNKKWTFSSDRSSRVNEHGSLQVLENDWINSWDRDAWTSHLAIAGDSGSSNRFWGPIALTIVGMLRAGARTRSTSALLQLLGELETLRVQPDPLLIVMIIKTGVHVKDTRLSHKGMDLFRKRRFVLVR